MNKLTKLTTILSLTVLAGVTSPVSVFAQSNTPADVLARLLNLTPGNSETSAESPNTPPEPSPQPSSSASPSPTPSTRPSPQPSTSPEPSPEVTPSPMPEPSPQPSSSASPSPTPSIRPSPQPTPTPEVVGDVEDEDPPPSDIGGSSSENEDDDEPMTVPRQEEQMPDVSEDVYEEVAEDENAVLPSARETLLRPLSVIVPDTATGFVPTSQYNYDNEVPEEVNTALSVIGINSLLLAGLLAKSEALIKLLPFNGALFNR